MNFSLVKSNLKRLDISHINSDMVVNTTAEEIVFIGYIGEEVNLDYTKPGGSLFFSVGIVIYIFNTILNYIDNKLGDIHGQK